MGEPGQRARGDLLGIEVSSVFAAGDAREIAIGVDGPVSNDEVERTVVSKSDAFN